MKNCPLFPSAPLVIACGLKSPNSRNSCSAGSYCCLQSGQTFLTSLCATAITTHEATRNGVSIHREVQDHIPLINAEEGALEEIFFNLIHNGIQAMPQGGTLSITAGVDDGVIRGNVLKIRVTDSGSGVSAESADKIFEPFYTTKQTGTGLGLSIVRKRLEEMGGSVSVENLAAGAGTSFIVRLPVQGGYVPTPAQAAGG